jgi:cation transport ATPase
MAMTKRTKQQLKSNIFAAVVFVGVLVVAAVGWHFLTVSHATISAAVATQR